MSVQDTPAEGGTDLGQSHPAGADASSGRPVRRLPVQREWPGWAILAVQIGILVGVIGLWETAATRGWIDAFFWSQPSSKKGVDPAARRRSLPKPYHAY